MPIITKLAFQKNQKRVNVFLDGTFAFGATTSTVLKHQLRVNQPLSSIEVQDLLLLSWQEELYNQTLTYLSSRPHSQREVNDYLKRRIFSLKRKQLASALAETIDWGKIVPTLINKSMDRLKKNKFVDDREFVLWWIKQRLAFRPRGKMALRLELRQKGVASEIIDELLAKEDLISTSIEEEAARRLAQKIWQRFKPHQEVDRQELFDRKKRLWQRLVSRGFSYEVVKTIVDDLVKKQ